MIEWRVADLHKALRPIARRLGVPAAEAMVAHFGGTRIHVPKSWRAGHPLTAVGDDLSKELAYHFAGEVLRIPVTLTEPEARVAKAQELRKAGFTVNEIARALGLSHRAAQEHLSGTVVRGRRRPRDERQIDIDDFLTSPRT